MKELSIEEKAKAYDNIIEKANKMHSENCEACQICIEELIPELKESEDEKIRKELIAFVDANTLSVDKRHDRYIAWLEKQGEQKHTAEKVLIKAGLKPYKDGDQWCILLGDNIQEGICGFGNTIEDALYAFLKDLIASQGEQKPTDKVEPKFKNGQWIVWLDKCYKVNYNGCGYELVDQDGLSTSLEYGTIDENAHLWTIQDAKDGDVLASDYEGGVCITILKSVVSGNEIEMYCHSVNSELFIAQSGFSNATWHPVTKEQRDTLMKAMADAGYEWNADKKKLEKIEKNPAFETKTPDECIDESTWGKEDERILNAAILHIKNENYNYYGGYSSEDIMQWLKSLKGRVQPQPKQEWSKEDERERKHCIDFLNHPDLIKVTPTIVDNCKNWLKSLRPQSTWKPSDEQINALYEATLEGEPIEALETLLSDLKKLREE